MKIGLYSPYWQTMGGGEKYMLDIARCFPEDEVIFIGDTENLIKNARDRFGFSHNKISLVADYRADDGKLKKEKLKNLDLFFYQCDGSVFIPPAKKNILLIQSPVHSPRGTFKDRIKMFFWQKVICNSVFTATYVKQKTGVSPQILNPTIASISPLPKKEIILSVGRFFPYLHSKKQEVLIETFKSIYQQGPGWRLVLAGAVSPSDLNYLNDLKTQSRGYPINFFENISYKKLGELYGEAKIFWHAAGYGEDLAKNPERAEHFGIATIEAISAGCYPLVFKAGGQTEILGDNNEFYWETNGELAQRTINLIENYEFKVKDYEKIKDVPLKYSFEKFKKKLYEICNL